MKYQVALQSQRGVTLVVTLVFLVALMLVALSASYSSVQEERFARNGRDFILAAESAEAALRFAENQVTIGQIRGRYGFVDCTTASSANGLCLPSASGPMHVLLNSRLSSATDTVTKAIDSSSWSPPSASLQAPRYVVEVFPAIKPGEDLTAQTGGQSVQYRITSRGFGMNPQINVTLESVYRPF
ncbi:MULTISPECIES: pilus assembly PilX family protein [Chromobacterium]|uniref:pilus assembly PilX family protein n=1 Tax=Chromobacterium TaxID=535 RepID=UPI0009DCBDD0|nr:MULTISPECIES: PilX N-terminal domain-containing pilus assembly protein [Chromobacterium]QOZ81910.1 hypothetical protein DXT74_01830 [Chromobacterium sp. Rain0013]WON81908.1 PilX N-terminal domain-containing pilus assembly protein [Chromobacterium haemolyticum]